MSTFDLSPMFCDVCAKPHRVDLSGPRCHDCKLRHGLAPQPSNPSLSRVEAVGPMVNARLAGIDWSCQEIPA